MPERRDAFPALAGKQSAAEPTGNWTPLIVLIATYTFFGPDALGDELSNVLKLITHELRDKRCADTETEQARVAQATQACFARPFGTGQNGLPIDATARGMEIEVHGMLGNAALTEPVRPVDYAPT